MARAAKPARLSELAARLGLEVRGDGQVWIQGFGSIESAGPDELAFVRSARLAEAARASRAAAFLVPPGVEIDARPCLESPDPARHFADAVEMLAPVERPPAGISPAATVDPSAQVDASAHVGASVVIGAGCVIGPGSVIHPHTTLYPRVTVGRDCSIHAGCVLREGTLLGDRVVLQPRVVIGGDGFGYVPGPDGRPRAVPHHGRVVLEDDVEVGAGTTIDRATLDETRIRRGAKIDNLVQIAHNCDVGEDVIVVAQSGLSGSTTVGRGAMLMAQSGAAGHLRIGDRAFVGARAGLHKDVADGARVWGAPQMEERTWHRAMAALRRLPDLLGRVRALERALGLRGESGGGDESSDADSGGSDRDDRG